MGQCKSVQVEENGSTVRNMVVRCRAVFTPKRQRVQY